MGCASHLIKSIVHLPAVLAPAGTTERDEVVGVDVLSVQKAQYSLESFLGAPHIAFLEVLPSDRVHVELAQRLTDLARLQDSVNVIFSGSCSLDLIDGVPCEQVVQVAEKTDLVGLHDGLI